VPTRTTDSPFTPKKARSTYDSLSGVYEYLTAYEGGAKRRGLKVACPTGGQVILEVGFGTGAAMRVIASGTGEKGLACGIDISPKMVRRAASSLGKAGLNGRSALSVAAAAHLPYTQGSFDAIFSSYVLDLMAEKEIAKAISEFFRVLRPGGRMALVSLTKGDGWLADMRLYEWLYRRSPSLLGGCRPLLLEGQVKEAGFINVRREFMMAGGLMPTEIISCDKPA
jgi:ubiquinone/menaquinone biosynthesis C-methylase UbiE